MHRRHEDGFSLVELLVVVTVLGILVAVAVPTFAAAGDRAGKRAAEVDLHTAANAALILAAEAGGTFVDDGTAITPADLHDEEPSLEFAATATGDVIGVSIEPDETTMVLTKYDRSGKLVELVLEAGRHLAAIDEGDSGDEDAVDGGNGRSEEHRQDGDTPAADNRPGNRR
jgi:prepilin-type N-terminal cleavage/methylation domain-containing protein